MGKEIVEILWYDWLGDVLNFCLEKMYSLYNLDDEKENGERAQEYVDLKFKEFGYYQGWIKLHPFYYDILSTIDERGYPNDYRQMSVYESLLVCLIEKDKDLFSELHHLIDLAFIKHEGIPPEIEARDAFIALFNDFLVLFLREHHPCQQFHITNGRVGATIEYDQKTLGQ
jgi:hypothetical protein